MADYISTLTGVQMDAALIDMAEHNSEAYAVGERNGIAVTTDDVTYHNNARYYAQQAQSIAPASVTEAVRWDVAQTALTDANKEMARSNIDAGKNGAWTNPNLLDNPFFQVNQRSATTITGSSSGVFSVDRWRLYGSITSLTVTNDGVQVNSASNGLLQRFDDNIGAYLNGKTVTVSAMDKDGNIASKSLTYSNASMQNTGTLTLGNKTCTIYLGLISSYQAFSITTGSYTIDLRAVKLELGSTSTLANDVPPDYGEELTRCIYSKADTTDTYANSGFGRTNPNLLDNPWFTINQRGQSSYTTASFGVDRWTFSGSDSNHTITINADKSVTINGLFYQKKEYYLQVGEAVTISYMTADGNIVSRTGTIPASQGFAVGSSDFGLYWRTTGVADFQIWATNLKLRAVKLEKGTVSTLANDVPPDYGEELAKCQRYFVRIKGNTPYYPFGIGFAMAQNSAAILVPLPVPMRGTTLTLSTSGAKSILCNGASGYDVSSITYYDHGGGHARLNVTPSSNSLTIGAVCLLQAKNATASYIDLSADL